MAGQKRQGGERDGSRKGVVEGEEKQHYLQKLKAMCYIPDIKKTALSV